MNPRRIEELSEMLQILMAMCSVKEGPRFANCLYIGANQRRQFLLPELIRLGYEVDICEAHHPNCRWLVYNHSNLGFRSLHEGDVLSLTPRVKYDLVFWYHGPEHVERELLPEYLKHLEEIGDLVILGAPKGPCPQGVVDGNLLEAHRWDVYPEDLQSFGYTTSEMRRIEDVPNIVAMKRTI
jgi:hypothetical protein